MTVIYAPEDYAVTFTSEEIAEKLHISSVRVVHEWLKAGALKGKKIGRRWIITKAAYKEFVAPVGEE